MDIPELKRLRSIIRAFANSVSQNWNHLDSKEACDRYHELYDMVKAASGDPHFKRYVPPISYWVTVPRGPLWRTHAVEILNSASQLFAYLDSAIGPEEVQMEHENSQVKLPHEKGDVVMGDKYEVGQAGAVGPGSYAHDMTFNQIWNKVEGTIDLPRLSEELAVLRQEMKKEATEPEHDIAIGAIAVAEQAAKTGNGPKTLESLRPSGKWALSVAEKIGVGVAIAALKSGLGI